MNPQRQHAEDIMTTVERAHFMFSNPTQEQIQSFRDWIKAGDRIIAQREESRIRKLVRQSQGDQASTCLITLSVDQSLSPADTVARQHKVIQRIISAKYKWLIEASYCFEYYSGEQNWNPHIHIKIDKTISKSHIAQQLRRKLKDLVYYINVSEKTEEIHSAYISGIKTESKTDNHKMDEVFRKDNNIKDIYLVIQ